MNEDMKKELQEERVEISLSEMLSCMNGIDEDGEAKTWGSIQINKLEKSGQISVIAEQELQKAIFEIHVRDSFIQLNVDFPKDARASLVLMKRVLMEYDNLCATKEDIQYGIYYMHMNLLPLEYLGQIAFVLRNHLLWINGEHPYDADVQRMTLLFERCNCVFVSTEAIDMISIRAEIERDIRQQQELEERAYLEQEENFREKVKKQEQQEINTYIMELSDMGNLNTQNAEDNAKSSRIRFSDTDNKRG